MNNLREILTQLRSMPKFSFKVFETLPQTDVSVRNPNAIKVESIVEQFAEKYGLIIDGFQETKTMTGFLYPIAEFNKYLTINELMAILFWIDDVFGDNQKLTKAQREQLLSRWFTALKFPNNIDKVYDDSITNALLEVALNIFNSSTREYYVRLLELFMEYLPENIALEKILGMNLNEYIEYRIKNSGMRPTIFLIQWGNDNILDKKNLENLGLIKIINQLERCVEIVGAISNDLFSWPKEVLVENLNANIIQVLMRSEGLSLEMAFKKAIEIVNFAIANFRELKSALFQMLDKLNVDPSLKESVKKHIINLENIIIASFEWQKFTNRYKHADHPFEELVKN